MPFFARILATGLKYKIPVRNFIKFRILGSYCTSGIINMKRAGFKELDPPIHVCDYEGIERKRNRRLHTSTSGGGRLPKSTGNINLNTENHERYEHQDLTMNRTLTVDVCRIDEGINARKVKTEEHEGCTSRQNGNGVWTSDQSEMKYISLIACGSFNPITNMHLRMFEIAKDFVQKKFDNVKVGSGLISPVSDEYRKKGLESAIHRLAMCTLATETNHWVGISSWESERSKWTPTLEVLKNAEENLPHNHKLMLLCGADFLESFTCPGLWLEKDIEQILHEYGLVVIQRPSFNPLEIIYENDILYNFRKNIHVVTDWITNDISSTKLRRALRRSESVRYLTPDSVVKYIEENNLYSNSESENKNSEGTLAPYNLYSGNK